MTDAKPGKARGRSVRKYLLAGILTAIPIVVTYAVFQFLVGVLLDAGGPAVRWGAKALRPSAPGLADALDNRWFQGAVAVVVVLAALWILGWLASRVVGRRIIDAFDRLVNRIPLVKTIYGSVKTVLTTFQSRPQGVQRVVLIDFPTPEMKAVGFVTRTMRDVDTGRELAAVYVPTTPNPTSGYLEIVPVNRIVSTDWTMDQAMTFIVSGGAVAPPSLNFDRSARPGERGAPEESQAKPTGP